VIVAQEIDISYSASVANAYIPSAYVNRGAAVRARRTSRRGPVRLGVDVARFGNDKTVFTPRTTASCTRRSCSASWTRRRRGPGQGLRAEWNEGKTDGRIEQIAVDVIGIGAGVVDAAEPLRGAERHPDRRA
jgi:phage terminase large subunit